MNEAIFFDLDGTLIDTAHDIHAATVKMLSDLNLPLLTFDSTRGYIGDGIQRFVKRVLTRQWWGEPDENLLQEAMVRIYTHYENECCTRLMIYPQVIDTLEALRQKNIKMACITNKPTLFVKPLLKASQLSSFFSVVICGDTFENKKPHPEPLLECAKLLSSDIQKTIMVGDSIADSKAAAAAGCRFIVVRYGYHRAGHLPLADVTIDSFSELLNCT